MKPIEIRLTISPALARAAFFCGLLAACATELSSESVTLSTYYPAPSGVYARMITTGETVLARDSGAVVFGSRSADPDPATATEGSIYYNSTSKEFKGFRNGAWTDLGGAGSKPIVCSKRMGFPGVGFVDPDGTGPLLPVGPTGNYMVPFTAADCGGVLPGVNDIGAASVIKMCNGVATFSIVKKGVVMGVGNPSYKTTNNTGPGVVLYSNQSCSNSDPDETCRFPGNVEGDGPCSWANNSPNGDVAEVTVLYFKP